MRIQGGETMMPTKQLIAALQDHFTERGRLANAMTAIKCYTKEASFFYSYKDGWGNKRCINLPFMPEDVLPILQKYIDNIGKDIIYSSIGAEIDSEEDLIKCIDEYKRNHPKTFTDIETVKQGLRRLYAERVFINENVEDENGDNIFRDKPYRIKVCEDLNGKFYEFWCVGRCKNTLLFGFNGISDYDTNS